MNIKDLFSPDPAVAAELERRVARIIAEFQGLVDVSSNIDEATLTETFTDSEIARHPSSPQTYLDYLAQNVVAHSVRTFSPRSMAHMTTATPYFIRPIGTLMMAMNQNMIKVDASRALTHYERQALAMMHRLVYDQPAAYYARHIQRPESSLGIMVSGGTLANITALWVARNSGLGPTDGFRGVEDAGLVAAVRAHGYRDVVIIGSRLMHYSFKKGADLLGLGSQCVVTARTDTNNRAVVSDLRRLVAEHRDRGHFILALVGIAGTTDAGSIDPLSELADLAEEADVHFHVDAAWGGPLLFSRRYRRKLDGLERADSVTIDGHKRLYLPTGVGMVLFRDPEQPKAIEKLAPYLIRAGSADLGKRSMEGSRPGTALFVHAALSLIGQEGYEALADHGMQLTERMVERVQARPELELLAEADLYVVLYRYLPAALREAARAGTLSRADNDRIDAFNIRLYRAQRTAGKTLVSRTTLETERYGDLVAMRAVIGNPLTSEADLDAVLQEQLSIGEMLVEDVGGEASQRARAAQFASWNATRSSYPRDRGIHELFEAQAARTPTAVALRRGADVMRYEELDARSNQLGHHLRDIGVAPGSLVVLCLPRSMDLVVAMLAILKTGAAYVALDPGQPPDRVRVVLSDCKARFVVTHEPLASVFASAALRVVLVDRAPLSDASTRSLGVAVAADSVAFVLYTSGSTGVPKGVLGVHREIVNRISWEHHPFEPDEVLCFKTGSGFIDSLWELFAALTRGLSSVMAPDESLRDPHALVQLLSDHAVTRLVLVPSMLHAVLDSVPALGQRLPALKRWICSGEPLPSSLARQFYALLPDAVLINIFGLTEAWDVSWHDTRISLGEAMVPIGKPVGNVQVYVLDDRRELVDVQVPGELYVGGDGLAAGYLDRPELTAERFIVHSIEGAPAQRLYRTGDIVRYLADGTLEYVGRADQQIKIHGLRIELGEVEAVLAAHPLVRRGAVVSRLRPDREPKLVAYVEPREATLDRAELRAFLASKLPEHMVPGAIVFVDTLPALPSGKLDRRALPEPDWDQSWTRAGSPE